MPIDSASTLTEVEAYYDDNASYVEDGSVTKAKRFVTACHVLLRRYQDMVRNGQGEEFQKDPRVIREALTEAKEYVDLHDTASQGARVTSADLRRFRG